jgi:hypothetical protein
MGNGKPCTKGVTVQTRLGSLIDAIDQLVDEQLARGETGYDLD